MPGGLSNGISEAGSRAGPSAGCRPLIYLKICLEHWATANYAPRVDPVHLYETSIWIA